MLEIPHRAFRIGSLREVIRLVREQKIEIIHSHGLGGGIYGRLASLITGVPCCYTPNGVTPVTNFIGACKAVGDFLFSAITARIIAVSAGEGVTLGKRCLRAARLAVIPNGVQVPAERISDEVFSARPLRVIHVTRFVYQKNSDLLIPILEALRQAGALGDFRFTLLGDGPERPQFEERLRATGLAAQVEFCGAIGNVSDYYKSAFAMLSTSRWEGLPLALLEAMALGVPVVASDVVGNCDAVRHGETGYLFDLAQPEEAARRLLELSKSRAEWMTLSQGARRRVEEEFSDSKMAERTLRVYREILGLDRPSDGKSVT
jgi:glycosyltransferase involved in cell wall biosynthesis